MTSKERILTVVKKGEAADKVPWSLNFGAYQTMRRSFLNRYKESRGIKENLFDLFDYDIIPVQSPEALDSNGESGTIKFLSNNIDPEKKIKRELTGLEFAELAERVGHLNGVPVINIYTEGGFGYARVKARDYQKDNIHLNDLGGKNMGKFVWSKLKDIPTWDAE